MSSTNGGPSVTTTPNVVVQAVPAGSSYVPFDPSSVAITGGTIGAKTASEVGGSALLKFGAVSSEPEIRRVAIAPTLGAESTSVQEPTVWNFGGLYHMLYTGGVGSPRLFYASAPSLDGPWTKNATAVIGGGTVIAGGAYHSSVMVDGNTLYCYFVDNTAATLCKVATASASAPTVWTLTGTTYALPAGTTQWGTLGVYKDPDTGVYHAFAEASSVGNSWQIAYGTLASPTGAMTITVNPVTSLRPSWGNAFATPGGAFMVKQNGEYVLYYHAGRSGSLPSEIFCAVTTNPATDSWTIQNQGSPVITRQSAWEVDQVADINLCQDVTTGTWVMHWTGMDNTTGTSRILWAPLRPGNVRTIGTTQYRVGGESKPSAGIADPQLVVYSEVTTDITLSSTTFADVAGCAFYFVPRTTHGFVTVNGAVSLSTGGNTINFQATDKGGLTKLLGSFAAPASGAQFAVSMSRAFTNLTIGQRYGFWLQYKVSAGTGNIRASTQPGLEGLAFSYQDMQWPQINA